MIDDEPSERALGGAPDTTGSPLFIGLSDRARLWIIVVATALGIASLGFAWYEASRVTESLRFGEADVAVVSQAYDAAKTGTQLDAYVYVHLLNVDAHMKGITNRHALGALAIGGGFALLALGFALFLLGADGAFKLQVVGRAGGNLQLQSAAPGIFCFLGAVALIGLGATRPHRLEIGQFAPPQTEALAQILKSLEAPSATSGTAQTGLHGGAIDGEAASSLADQLLGTGSSQDQGEQP